MAGFFGKLKDMFGSNEREVTKLQPIIDKINAFESDLQALGDDKLKHKTNEFRDRLKTGETEDDILPEAFAVVREAARRAIGQRHYDVQLLGGMVLHQGKIAEMRTGEGKTLTSTLPIYLNALSGKGVHVVTVNDYLARRDCNWMGVIYHFLGLSTACVVHESGYRYEPKKIDTDEVSIESENLRPVTRKDAYRCDITYGTNNEFGFDYLRDNMAQSLDVIVQREPNFSIVDEVDSILIDEARTPLIISAPDTQSTDLYVRFSAIAKTLVLDTDYTIDEKMKAVTLTDDGINKVEKSLGIGNIYEPGRIQYVHQLEQALKAHAIFERDRDYVIKDDEVVIVDDFTGRLTPGRRFSEGLHQALEAKEGVAVQRESRTLATITFQNYFRLYNKLSGMTGTALTSMEEFAKVYGLDVVEIPTNRPMVRDDRPDVIYTSERGKHNAVVERVKELHATGQPVLVGTVAIEKSEVLSKLLKRAGVKHEVLNAKNNEKEAAIVSMAGQRNAVTIATNLAGRGTDIKLGDGVKELGGLFILGTERHEARRIDNQLRGRSGRQGDPGASQFFVSLDDELLRRFGGDRLKGMLGRLGLPDDQPIQNKFISKQIESAQSKIEGFNFDIRKQVLQYDDVMNKQREVVYARRREILKKENIKPFILETLSETCESIVTNRCVGEEHEWLVDDLIDDISTYAHPSEEEKKQIRRLVDDGRVDGAKKISNLHECVFGILKHAYNKKESELTAPVLRRAEKLVYLRTIDLMWMNHLDEMEYMRQGIGLRGYGQRDPLIEYKKEAFHLFSGLMDGVRHTALTTLFKLEGIGFQEKQTQTTSESRSFEYSAPQATARQFGNNAFAPSNTQSTSVSTTGNETKKAPLKKEQTVGRNDPCPCGSGKKYKKCHGA